MAVTGIQFGSMWARNFDDSYSYSVTVQVPGVAAVCEIALHSTWTADSTSSAADAMVTQIVSASGVENFPDTNRVGISLVPIVFRRQVTSVTFKVYAGRIKAMARWMVFHWA
jgi:hypothetical protein